MAPCATSSEETRQRARDVPETRQTLFFWVQPALVVLASCRQSDDIVATLKKDEPPETSVPPPEDAAVPPPDVSSEHDAPPVTIDNYVPPPPIDVAIDPGIPPPPVDAITPPTCDGTSPILSVRRVNGARSEACAGQVAAHTFTHALCACEDLNLAAALTTGSFDSTAADTTPVSAGAAVGIGGNYPPTAASIGGSLTVAGTRQFSVSGGLRVEGDLRLAGVATIFAGLTVKRDIWLMSRVSYVGFANIGRNLVLAPPGGMLQPVLSAMPVIGGATIPMTFTVEDPCGCAERLDVAEMERIGRELNQNAARGIDPAALTNVNSLTSHSLCGRFRFDSIGGAGPLQLTITGRTAIFVDGNVSLSDAFQLVIAPGADAELDWFIRGNLSIGARAQIGDPARPSATRIYVGGPETDAGSDNTDIVLSSGQIGANIYAPNTNVNITATGMAGSIYAKNLSILGIASVRYDRAVLSKGDKCEQPIACDKCHSCNGGTACIGGTCQPCMHDDECCAPLVCKQGSCQPLLFP